jgi:hypothetical protein
MTRSPLGLVRILLSFLLFSVSARTSEIVFENMTGITTNYYMFGRQYGDDINLAGTGRIVTGFSFLYFASVPTNTTSPGLWRIRFYRNDGALENPAVATSQKPGSLIWDSGTYPVLSGYQKTTLEVPKVTVPDRFTWTVEFYNLPQDPGNGAGLVLAHPPTIGAALPGKNSTVIGSYTDFWMLEEADILDSWTLQVFSTNPNQGPQGNFFAQVVTVANPNQAPVWSSAPLNRRVSEGSSLSFQLRATDADLPPQPLSYRLVSGPAGLTVGTNGFLSWRPTEEQGPSTNRVRVEVSDGTDGASQEFTIVVQEQNTPPTFAAVGTRRVTEGQRIAFQLRATDADLPAQRLTYRLTRGPAGLAVTDSGLLSWTPTPQQGPSTNRVQVAVTDPFTTTTHDFDIIVRDTAPATGESFLALSPGNGRAWNLQLRGTAGVSFVIERNTRLGNDGWATIPGVAAIQARGLSETVSVPVPEQTEATVFFRARRP